MVTLSRTLNEAAGKESEIYRTTFKRQVLCIHDKRLLLKETQNFKHNFEFIAISKPVNVQYLTMVYDSHMSHFLFVRRYFVLTR